MEIIGIVKEKCIIVQIEPKFYTVKLIGNRNSYKMNIFENLNCF